MPNSTKQMCVKKKLQKNKQVRRNYEDKKTDLLLNISRNHAFALDLRVFDAK